MKKIYSNPQTELMFLYCSNVMNRPGAARYGMTPVNEPGDGPTGSGTILSSSSHS